MYENLVKRLNAYSAEHENHGGITAEAADAIEELSRRVEKLEALREISPEAEYTIDKHADNPISHMEELISGLKDKPHWIPVTEKLPKAYEEVLLLFQHNQAVGFCDRDGCWGVYSGNGFYTEVADNEVKPTHWAKKLPEPPKEEKTHG